MIARNEATHISECLRSARGLFAEIVVVDTGSTDDTRQIAASLGAKVYEFAWCDDFAAARNECLGHAATPWVFWLDADDRIDTQNRDRLEKLLASLGDEDVAYAMNTFSIGGPDNPIETVVNQMRLFRNLPGTRWEYRVHEQILPSLRARGAEVRGTDITIVHTGYQNEATRRHKVERNLRLLRLDHADRPDDPFVLFNLGWTLQDLGRHEDSIPYIRGALERLEPTASIVRKAYSLLVAAHLAGERINEAFAACQTGLLRCPDDVELRFVLSQLLAQRGDLVGAVVCLEQLLQTPTASYFGSIDTRLTGHGVHFELAKLHTRLGHAVAAEEHYRLATKLRPDFIDGWLELADLLLVASRWADFEVVLQTLTEYPRATLPAQLLRARAHMARAEFAAARGILEPLSRAFPEDIRPILMMAYALLQESVDMTAAEMTLREVTARAPELLEPWQNTVILLRSGGRLQDALTTCLAARKYHPTSPKLHLLEALTYYDLGDTISAQMCLEDLLVTHEPSPTSPTTATILEVARELLRTLTNPPRASES